MYSKKAMSISESPTLAIDAKFKEMKQNGVDVIGFGTGEPDFDTPEHIKQAAITAINEGFTKYTPAAGIPQLKQAVCNKFKRDNNLDYKPNQIVISNGAKHSLINVFGAILNPGDEVIILVPFWVSYPEMVKLADGVPIYVDTDNNFRPDMEAIESAITPKTRAIIINSPSNPTGVVFTKEELEKIAAIAVKHNIYVISDEVYETLLYDGCVHYSIASLNDEIKELTIIVNAVSKTYAMTGWRIGYTASNSKIAGIMSNVQSHATSNPNSIAQKAAIAAISGPQDDVSKMKIEFEKRREYLVDRINANPNVSCVTPQGAFYVMMNIKNLLNKEYFGRFIKTADDFADILLEKAHVAIVSGTGFNAPGYLRWSYATSMDNIKKGFDRFEELLKG